MKIGIITLTFNTNYGGILQAYALQMTLKKMGHNAITINRETAGMTLKMKCLSVLRRVLLTATGKKNVVIRTWPNKNENKIISQHTNRFIAENIKTTPLFKSENDFHRLKSEGFETYIVGSDQVWRPKYSPDISNHFLNFVNGEQNLKRISYAASFGVDEWEYNEEQTKICKKLVQQFNAVSVREDSGVLLCNDYLGVSAIRVIDPTLLISKEEYVSLVLKDKIPKFEGTLLNFVLDKAPDKQEIIQRIEKELQLKTYSTLPETSFRESGKKKLKECIFPPVTYWIRGFMDAEFVVTDSFHGTVFSIIFNKPFLAIGNEKRGLSRFTSLLKIFGLEERLIFDNTADISKIIKTPIDYEKINTTINSEKSLAMMFLANALNN